MNMDILFWVILIFALGFFLARMMPAKGVNTIDAVALKEVLHDKNIQFIDVRSPAEFAGRKIEAFRNIPLQQIQSEIGNLDKSKEVILLCQSGMRSSQAAKVLKKAGFEHVTNVKGGIAAWRA